MEIFLALSVMF